MNSYFTQQLQNTLEKGGQSQIPSSSQWTGLSEAASSLEKIVQVKWSSAQAVWNFCFKRENTVHLCCGKENCRNILNEVAYLLIHMKD